jgi:hypothetical protein
MSDWGGRRSGGYLIALLLFALGGDSPRREFLVDPDPDHILNRTEIANTFEGGLAISPCGPIGGVW